MKKVNLSCATITFDPIDKILVIEGRENAQIGRQEAEEIIDVVLSLCKDSVHANLFIGNKLLRISKEARNLLAKTTTAGLVGTALLSDNLYADMIANFYLRFSNPISPTKVFANKNDAKTWLATLITDSRGGVLADDRGRVY